MLTPRFYVLDDDRAITENIDFDRTVSGTYYMFKGKPKQRTAGHSLGRRVVYYLYPENISCSDPAVDITKAGFRFRR